MLLSLRLFSLSTSIRAQDHFKPDVFFDADQTDFDKEGKFHIFEGHVVAIASGLLVAADRLEMDREKNIFTASGHVLVHSSQQVYSGTMLRYLLDDGQIILIDGIMLANDPFESEKINKRLLGFSPSEAIYYENQRKQIRQLENEKEKLRDEFAKDISDTEREHYIERYEVLLRKQNLIANKDFKEIVAMDPERKKLIERRKKYWQKARSETQIELPQSLKDLGYFKVEGSKLISYSKNEFAAEEAFFTPCFCQEGESAPWGFRAAYLRGQGESYLDMDHPVLLIKGVPVFYLPFLRLPLKATRQSGFLLPNLTHTQKNGSIYSQPVYFAFDESSDATLYTDMIEKRGIKLGFEYRIQQKQYSGWEFKFESIRDRLWLEQKFKRKAVIDRYQKGLDKAHQYIESDPKYKTGLPEDHSDYLSEADPAWWNDNGLSRCLEVDEVGACKKYNIDNYLKAPENPWRGSLEWKGQNIIAPRLTFMSQGKLLSDHRYDQDLEIPAINLKEEETNPHSLSISRLRFHLDGKDFYAGLGSGFADPFLSRTRFSGYQLPFYSKIQTRFFSLTNERSPLQLFGQFKWEQRRIEVFKDLELSQALPKNILQNRLSNGTWQRLNFDLSSPLLSDGIIQSDLFAQSEYRFIDTDPFKSRYHVANEGAERFLEKEGSGFSAINSFKNGIHFSLPLDGSWPLPSFLSSNNDGLTLNHNLGHRMNWEVTFTNRPYVSRRGPYGQGYFANVYSPGSEKWLPIESSGKMTYFEDDLMETEKSIKFETSHSWFTYRTGWDKIPSVASKEDLNHQETKGANKYREQAERELFFSLDRPLKGHKEMFSDKTWYINRYQVSEKNWQNPLQWEAEISFDYEKEKKRKKEKEYNSENNLNNELTEAWSLFDSSLVFKRSGWSLGIDGKYNLYKKIVTEMDFGLIPPSFYGSQMKFEYHVDKVIERTTEGAYSATSYHTRYFKLNTSAIKNFTIGVDLGTSNKEDTDTKNKYARFSSIYLSPTDCWGFKFEWIKSFAEEDWKGTYYLGLIVKFLAYGRDFGNFTSRFNRSYD